MLYNLVTSKLEEGWFGQPKYCCSNILRCVSLAVVVQDPQNGVFKREGGGGGGAWWLMRTRKRGQTRGSGGMLPGKM